MAAAPLAVWGGEIQPQPPGTVLPHDTDQFTPPGEASFATVALTEAWVVATMEVGGAACVVHESDGGCATMVVNAEA
jgi:hypothetical protein